MLALAAPLAGQAPPQAGSQGVRGTIRDEGGAPLSGARVVVAAPDGGTPTATLSDAQGTFRVRTPTDGTYRISAELPGYTFAPATVEAGAGAAELTGRRVVVALPDDEAEPDRACALEPEDAAAVAAAWGEVRKAFGAAVTAQESGLVRFETETWYKQLDPRRLRVVEESHTPRPGFHAVGRVPSPPAEELVREGYVRGGGPGESLSFFAPDAGTLLSPTFAATHCLGFDADGPEHGWVGLTFRPRDEDRRDVEGTLWIDAEHYEPMRLDYRYTTLPWPVKADKTGGRLDFGRTESGALVVQEWWMRMPRVQLKNVRITQWAEPRPRYTLSALVEEGGRVLRVQSPDGQIEDMR